MMTAMDLPVFLAIYGAAFYCGWKLLVWMHR